MFTKTLKWISIVALLLAVLRLPTTNFRIFLEALVCVSGLVVLTQAARAGKYLWAAGFLAIAVLFNPVVPIMLSRRISLWLDVICLMTFLISLAALKSQPRLSMPSITSRTPGSESL